MGSKVKLVLAFGLASGVTALVFALIALQPAAAVNATTSKNSNKSPAIKIDKTVYHYVAQSGDSYTKMARKAAQTYGKTHNVKLQNSQIIYIETNMTQTAASPLLNLGQKVDIPAQTVAGWIAKAQKLTSEQLAAWQYYVQFVDFNTDHVGQP